MSDWVQLGAVALGSVGLWTFLEKIVLRFWGRADTERSRAHRRAADAERKAEEALQKHDQCEEKVRLLEAKIDLMERHSGSCAPRWLRTADRRILWINDAAMLAIFAPLGITREHVEGRTFADLLDVEAAREIDRLDRAALAHPGSPVSTLLTLHQSLRPMHVFKIATVGRDRELIYEGYAFPLNEPEDVDARASERRAEQHGLSTLRADGKRGKP